MEARSGHGTRPRTSSSSRSHSGSRCAPRVAGAARTTARPPRRTTRPTRRRPVRTRPCSRPRRRRPTPTSRPPAASSRTRSRPRRNTGYSPHLLQLRHLVLGGATGDLRPGDRLRRQRQAAAVPRRVGDADSDDYMTWTVKFRKGIKFHDGVDLNAQALVTNIEASRCSALIGPAWGEFGGCPFTYDAEPAGVAHQPQAGQHDHQGRLRRSRPTPSRDRPLPDPGGRRSPTRSPCSWSSRPRSSTSRIRPARRPRTIPVGTGPFVFKDWTPNDHLTVEKNPTYWRKGLPYLDQIVFKPINDVSARGTRSAAARST